MRIVVNTSQHAVSFASAPGEDMPLSNLLKYFPSGTAEGELAILDQVFVYADELSKVISPPEGNPYLLVGDKGSGKTALIEFSSRLAKRQGIPAIVLTPFDFDTSEIDGKSSTGDMTRNFYSIILAAIAGRLSDDNSGWLDSDFAVLYREAVSAGTRSPDFATKIGKFLSAIAKPVIKVDMAAAFPHLTVHTQADVEKSLESVIGRTSFYLFIDDTDQIGSPEEAGHLNRIWSLLLAVRRLSSKIPELRVVISLRTEVWQRLQRDQAGQRDQTDHFRTLIVQMASSRAHVERILDRRLSLANVAEGSSGNGYSLFFENDGATAPYSTAFRSWKDLIVVRSRERPRDAIQLVNALAQNALKAKKRKVDEGAFHAVMPEFSRDISERFAQEVATECPQALEILKSFAMMEYDHPGFTVSSDIALKQFKLLFSRFGVTLYGRPLGSDLENDSFDLWKFFYVCGVLNARVSDSTQKDQFRHLRPEEDLSLVSKIRWNDLQKLLWEINAAYRDYLIQLQKEEEVRVGLPIKRKPHRPGRRGR